MIEFKGECGHTIRARDEDAGKVVRCTYCGKEALVSRQPQDDLDVLFDQVEQTGAYDAQATQVGQKFHRVKRRQEKRLAAGKPAKAFDPFNIAMKMTYVALVIIVAFMGMKYVPGWYEKLTGDSTQSPRVENTAPPRVATNKWPGTSQGGKGLLTESLSAQQEGVYVSSVPPGAGIYHLAKTSVTGSILAEPGANKNARTNKALRLRPGKHTIAVALRVNDSELMKFEAYKTLRKQLEDDVPDKNALIQEFFVPDGSISSRVEKLRGALHLVRVFECEVDSQSWESITALFLPRSLNAEQMVERLPRKICYGFDDQESERELDFYGVPRKDQRFVKDALKRVGMVSYSKEEDGSYWLFRIDPGTGSVMSRRISQQ